MIGEPLMPCKMPPVFIEDTAKGYGIFADEMYSKTSEFAESTIENAG